MGMQKTYAEDSLIIMENTINKYIFMVLEGSVALYMNYKKPDEYLLGLCNKGNAFGEVGVLCHEESIYTAVAATDTVVAVFSEAELGSFVRGHPDQVIGIMKMMARINRILNLNLRMVIEDNKSPESAGADGSASAGGHLREPGQDGPKQVPRCRICGSDRDLGVTANGYICMSCLKKRSGQDR